MVENYKFTFSDPKVVKGFAEALSSLITEEELRVSTPRGALISLIRCRATMDDITKWGGTKDCMKNCTKIMKGIIAHYLKVIGRW